MGEANRFNATLGVTNAPAASEAWEYIKNGQPVPDDPPKMLRTMVGDYIGAGNYWITNQESFVPVGYTKDAAGNFIKQGSGPVPPTDPLARVKAAPSQWAKWFGLSDAEATALIEGGYITRDQKNLNNNWWALNGVKGRYDGTTYYFYTYPGGVETTNIDATISTNPTLGKADVATEEASGQTMPGPPLP